MKGPPLGPGGEDITWPNQVAPQCQKASSTRKVKPQTSNVISPEAALYGHWMELRTSNQSGRPLSMGDTRRLTGAGSAMSLHSSAPALLHALRTRCPGDRAPYLNQARATYPGGVSELDAVLHLLHQPDEDLEVGEITVFVEGAEEAPTRPRPTKPMYDGARPTPPVRRHVRGVPQGAHLVPRPPTNDARAPLLDLPESVPSPLQDQGWTRSGSPRVVTTRRSRGVPGRSCQRTYPLGATPTHPYGAAPVPRPPLPAPAARGGVHTFLQTQEVTAVTGVNLVRLPSATPDDPRGPRALSPAPDWELWRDV